ncbi:hypothetical protein [Nonomuraea sp. NPDC001699]
MRIADFGVAEDLDVRPGGGYVVSAPDPGEVGAGMGPACSPALNAALTRVAPTDTANASGLMSTATQLGQVAGIAGLGAVFLALHVPSPSAATAATGVSRVE